nr:MAK10-like protein [Tanacetum cinerariifolium]
MCTLRDYSKPSHEGYNNTIELLIGNKVVPLRSDTIRLVQNGCSFPGLRFEDPNQHLKDFLKLVNSLNLDDENRERTMDSFQGLTTKSPSSWHRPLAPSRIFLTMSILSQDEPLTNQAVDFAKPVKAITLPQYFLSASDCCLIELKNQVQRLMKAHLALTQPTQVNKVTTSCEICSGPYDTQYFMEDPEQAFVEYASSCTNEAEGGDNHSTPLNPSISFISKVLKFNSFFKSLGLVPQSSDTKVVFTKRDDEGEVT